MSAPELTKSGLIAFAGYDEREKPLGWPNAKVRAVSLSRMSLSRYAMLRHRSLGNPPAPARGGFPYFRGENS
jgi:hypothetical protein